MYEELLSVDEALGKHEDTTLNFRPDNFRSGIKRKTPSNKTNCLHFGDRVFLKYPTARLKTRRS